MDSGKDFEARVSRSLNALKGRAKRIEDGGAYAYNRQLGDYYYWPDGPGTVVVECKAVKGTYLPLSRLGIDKPNGQLSRMLDWEGRWRKPVLAVCYYEQTVAKGRCYLVRPALLLGLERASLSESDAKYMGIECHKQGDHYDMTALEAWFDRR